MLDAQDALVTHQGLAFSCTKYTKLAMFGRTGVGTACLGCWGTIHAKGGAIRRAVAAHPKCPMGSRAHRCQELPPPP